MSRYMCLIVYVSYMCVFLLKRELQTIVITNAYWCILYTSNTVYNFIVDGRSRRHDAFPGLRHTN